MGILDWWCHPFHHCPNSSFNSLEFHLRNNLPWILIGWRAVAQDPGYRSCWHGEPAKSLCPAVRNLAPLCPRDTAPPGLPGLSCAPARGQLLFSETNSALTLSWLSPAFPRLLSPYPEGSCLDSSPQHLFYPKSRKSRFNSPTPPFRAECG